MESAEIFVGAPGTDYTNGLVTIGGWLTNGTRQPNLTVNNYTRQVGIGTTAPSALLHVSSSSGGRVVRIDGPSTADNYLSLHSGTIEMFIDADSTNTSGIVGTQSNHNLILRTNGTNKVWVKTDGNVGIGSSAPVYSLDVNGQGRFISNSSSRVLYLVQNATNAGNIIQFQNESKADIGEIVYRNNQFYVYSNATSGYIIYGNPSNNNVGIGYGTTSYKLDVNGDIRATADVIAYSDARVKENVQTVEDALEKVKLLRGVTYTRKDIDDKSEKIGVIAQEVLEVLPQVVSQDDEGQYSVAYGNMVGVLIEAIKEQQKQIDELKYLLQTQNK
jgi:hypothetical protein